MSNKLQEIRKKLYLRRDGASSTSMREKGVEYKINFGVPIPTLREIAQDYSPDSKLADELWEKDTRELKILATMIQDIPTFQKNEEWVETINNVELAEQSVMNLFSKIPNASTFASKWIQSDKLYTRLCGYLLYTRLFMKGYIMEKEEEKNYFLNIFKAFGDNSILIKNAAINSLKHLGRQSIINSKTVLAQVKGDSNLCTLEKENLYDDLLFEFEQLQSNISDYS